MMLNYMLYQMMLLISKHLFSISMKIKALFSPHNCNQLYNRNFRTVHLTILHWNSKEFLIPLGRNTISVLICYKWDEAYLASSIYRHLYLVSWKSLPNYAMKLSIPLHCHGKLINIAAMAGLHYYCWLCQKLNKREFIICFLLPCKIWMPRFNVSNQMKLMCFKCLLFAKYFTMQRKLYLGIDTIDKLSQKHG